MNRNILGAAGIWVCVCSSAFVSVCLCLRVCVCVNVFGLVGIAKQIFTSDLNQKYSNLNFLNETKSFKKKRKLSDVKIDVYFCLKEAAE